MKHMLKKNKIVVKKWSFGGKMQVIGLENIASWQPNRKAKWCKMQVDFLKWTKIGTHKTEKCG